MCGRHVGEESLSIQNTVLQQGDLNFFPPFRYLYDASVRTTQSKEIVHDEARKEREIVGKLIFVDMMQRHRIHQ